MTYDELVEKVAYAIDPHAEARDSLGYTSGGKEYARKVAEAAIATIAGVLKEPTEAMVSAGKHTICCHGWSSSGEVIDNPQDVLSDMLAVSPLNPEKSS